jgi:hypothetical protein
MQLAMVAATQRNRELVANLSSHCLAFGKAKVMWIRRAPSADQAGLLDDRVDVIPVASSPRFSEGQPGLVNTRHQTGTRQLSRSVRSRRDLRAIPESLLERLLGLARIGGR